MAASNIMRRMNEAEARGHKRRGEAVLVVQFVQPCLLAPESLGIIP